MLKVNVTATVPKSNLHDCNRPRCTLAYNFDIFVKLWYYLPGGFFADEVIASESLNDKHFLVIKLEDGKLHVIGALDNRLSF